ncbi:hypothetical protein AB0H18_20610 [Streptomyces sp. NPDC020766]|uniref:hypothetical protein n=1 Tax=Streptomyces sp. NPDC020766 TaxID=3155011 RepID=UPI0033DF8EB6
MSDQTSPGEWVERFRLEATRDPRVTTRLQEELDNLDESALARMRNASNLGVRCLVATEMEDGTAVVGVVDPASLR